MTENVMAGFLNQSFETDNTKGNLSVTGQKLINNYQKRVQNQLLISIKCSKAIDPKRYEKLVQQFQEDSQFQQKSRERLKANTSSQGSFPAIQYQDQTYSTSSNQQKQQHNMLQSKSRNERSFIKPNQRNKTALNFHKPNHSFYQGEEKASPNGISKVNSLLSNNQDYMSKSQYQDSLVFNKNSSSINDSNQKIQEKALINLRKTLYQKGFDDRTINESYYDLYHFQIDTQNDNISLNKYETSPNVNILNQSRNSIHSSYLNSKARQTFNGSSIDNQNMVYGLNNQSSKFFNVNKYFQNKRVSQEPVYIENQISEDLIKDSPSIKQHKRRGTLAFPQKQFMMNLQSTNLDQNPNEISQIIKRKQQSILYCKEIDDNAEDYFSFELQQLRGLNIDQLKLAYSILMKQANPLFSGSVNTLINKLDLSKLNDQKKSKLNINQVSPDKKNFSDVELMLMDELRSCKDKLEKQEICQALWSILPHYAQIPESREGVSIQIIRDNVYIYGGFSRELFGQIRIYDFCSGKWSIIDNTSETPKYRFSQTMEVFNRKLYVFGGAGTYVNQIKMRLGYNDLHIFDTVSETWNQANLEGSPQKRYNHASAIFGSIMMIHGGFFADQRKLLNDFALFDCDMNRWIMTRVYCNQERIDDKNYQYSQVTDQVIGFRQMHSMTAIYERENYSIENKGGKALWRQRRVYTDEEREQGPCLSEGVYLFGGSDQKGQLKNDVWFIEPYYKECQQILAENSFEYLDKPTLTLYAKKIENYKGKPPCPRSQHQASYFREASTNYYYLVIFGGRNDSIFAETQNVALNDICMFNVVTNEWTALAIYGQIPTSRWSHGFTKLDDNGKFILFGGVNLKSYCKSRLYQVEIIPQQRKRDRNADRNQRIDFRIQNLVTSVKSKIDIIKELINVKQEQLKSEQQSQQYNFETANKQNIDYIKI
ncbi:kelch motif family protein [Stylonychia lemnae]|uniref:Kelch motif family protein n=1 Tax=Stylonychia lemnae TaxID=5949 RepID=A0A078AI66_STYLE|nr:kelch motif family protein [Stylonychia lemnae]|eukprot:CDW80498.1 kelch motif family protein [Stylonychia lemnae]